MNAALILTALLNGAWQGAVVCTLAVLAFPLFRRLNATTMFTVWSVLLAIAVLLPFANYVFAPKAFDLADAGEAAALSIAVSRFAPEILIALAAIGLVRLALLACDVIRMLCARSRVQPIDSPVPLSGEISRPFRFAASRDFTSPCVLGFAPALIVIPEELLAQPRADLTGVMLHEREHVRRFDDIQNLVQRLIGALGFFCPGVRIALRELALYREQICDDAAVNATGDRFSYAVTLTQLAQWARGRGTPVPSLIFKRTHLTHRLDMLLDSGVSHSLHTDRGFALSAAAALIFAAALVLRIQVPVVTDDSAHIAAAGSKCPLAAASNPHTHNNGS